MLCGTVRAISSSLSGCVSSGFASRSLTIFSISVRNSLPILLRIDQVVTGFDRRPDRARDLGLVRLLCRRPLLPRSPAMNGNDRGYGPVVTGLNPAFDVKTESAMLVVANPCSENARWYAQRPLETPRAFSPQLFSGLLYPIWRN
jgi:hypothetical protein